MLILSLVFANQNFTAYQAFTVATTYTFSECFFSQYRGTTSPMLWFENSAMTCNFTSCIFADIRVTEYIGCFRVQSAAIFSFKRSCFTYCHGFYSATGYIQTQTVQHSEVSSNYEYACNNVCYGFSFGSVSSALLTQCNYSYATSERSGFGPVFGILPSNPKCSYCECIGGDQCTVFSVRHTLNAPLHHFNILNNTLSSQGFVGFYYSPVTGSLAITSSYFFGNTGVTVQYCTITDCLLDFELDGNTYAAAVCTAPVYCDHACHPETASFTPGISFHFSLAVPVLLFSMAS